MPDLRVSFPRPCDEPWEAMTKTAGCDRVCGRCDRVIHDLSHYDVDEAEALLREDPRTCVRATIGADGAVALKPRRGGTARRMVIAAAAAAGLLATSAPALATRERPGGAISGIVQSFGTRVRVTATGADGRTYRAMARRDGQYRIEHLPAGTYRLSFVPVCGEGGTVENVVVREGEAVALPVKNVGGCVVVGQLLIDEPPSNG